MEVKEQRTQARYSDKSVCATSDHPQYDGSLPRVLGSIQAKVTGDGNTYDLCYIEDTDGDLEYLLFVNGIGYPTCVSAPTLECLTDKFYCVEAERYWG